MSFHELSKHVRTTVESAGYVYRRPSKEDLRAAHVDAAKQALYVVTAAERMCGARRYQEPTEAEKERARQKDYDQRMRQQLVNLKREFGGEEIELLDLELVNHIRTKELGLPALQRSEY